MDIPNITSFNNDIHTYIYICRLMDAYTRMFACYITLSPNKLFNRMVSLSAVPTPKWIFGWEFGRGEKFDPTPQPRLSGQAP